MVFGFGKGAAHKEITPGELAAMVVVDAVARLLPEVLAEGSPDEESHSRPLLEYPHYTRPANFRGWTVPETLVSGHHAKVEEWRFKVWCQFHLNRLTSIEFDNHSAERKLSKFICGDKRTRRPLH